MKDKDKIVFSFHSNADRCEVSILKWLFIQGFNLLPTTTDKHFLLSSAQHILVDSLGAKIGDTVALTFFLRELKKRCPHARITVVLLSAYIPLLNLNPYVDEVVAPFSSFHAFLVFLRARRFDVIVNIPGPFSMMQLLGYYFSGAKAVVTGNQPRYRFINHIKRWKHDAHITKMYQSFLDMFGSAASLSVGYDIFLPAESAHVARKYISTVRGEKNDAVLVFNPEGSSAKYRTLSAGKVSCVLRALAEQNPKLKIILLNYGGRYSDICLSNVQVCRPASLLYMVALIKYADYILTVDTGTLHLADAFYKKMVVLRTLDSPCPNNQLVWGSIQPGTLYCTCRPLETVNDISIEVILNAVKKMMF